MGDELFCPYCNTTIIIESINCGIFRCGIYKENGQQIPPHSTKYEIEKLLDEKKIWGCGQPFQLHNDKLIKCGWI